MSDAGRGSLPTAEEVSRVLASEQRRLFGLAYRMLGSVVDAEDVVQEAVTRWSGSRDVRDPAAWLTTAVTRLSIDQMQSARRRRETYVGEWLPEPLATDEDPADVAGTADALAMAFLVVLETLSPLERAALLLHDVFGHEFTEVAEMLDRSPSAVRQLASRARGRIRHHTPAHPAAREESWAVVDAFLAACEGDDLAQVMDLLAPDVLFVSDGGGKASAVPVPLAGADRVGRMLLGFVSTGRRRGFVTRLVGVNGGVGVWVQEGEDTRAVLSIEVLDGQIIAIRSMRNPDKLQRFRAAPDALSP